MPVDPLHAVTPVIEIADRIFNFIKGKTNAQRLKLIAALVGEAFTQKMEESDVLAEWRDKERWARIVNQIGLLRAQNAELQYRYDCMKLTSANHPTWFGLVSKGYASLAEFGPILF